MNSAYLVVNVDGMYSAHTNKPDAVACAKRLSAKTKVPSHVYKLVADVVTETRTVTEVIDYER